MIRLATAEDAHLIHKVMLAAYDEYRNFDIPSSAINETVSSIEEALISGTEKALLCFMDGIPVGAVRFITDESSLYFFRLSVIPEARNKGIAKFILSWLEDYSKELGLIEIWCKVRMSIPKNIKLYESFGYSIFKKEEFMHKIGIPITIVSMKKLL